ncbi:MAG: GNAT family N-acetyltransferase [Bacteroides sp.]|nr:GNAT family N-acetyltransferase [Bacteroides sp.]
MTGYNGYAPDAVLETERLILRPWEEADAGWLYEYARNPEVGPAAGWPVHTDEGFSRDVIRDVFSAPGTYAVVPRAVMHPVGCAGLMVGDSSNLHLPGNEGEIGYWIGVPYWGQGLIPEAVSEMARHAFADLNLETLWGAYFDGNHKSMRVLEKCGFRYHRTDKDAYWPLTDEIRTEHVCCLTRSAWESVHDA